MPPPGLEARAVRRVVPTDPGQARAALVVAGLPRLGVLRGLRGQPRVLVGLHHLPHTNTFGAASRAYRLARIIYAGNPAIVTA